VSYFCNPTIVLSGFLTCGDPRVDGRTADVFLQYYFIEQEGGRLAPPAPTESHSAANGLHREGRNKKR